MFKLTRETLDFFVRNAEPKANIALVQQMEAELGFSLPKPYVEFITDYGFVLFDWGKASLCAFHYQITYSDRIEVSQGDIAFMIDGDKIPKMYRYITEPQCENDDEFPMFPKAFLQVGNSKGEDLILLKISGDQIGSVWFWQFNNSAWGTEDNTWLGYVAKDFYEFINNLRPYE